MEKLELSVKDSSLAFVSAFLLGQLTAIVFACLSIVVSTIFNIPLESYLKFSENSIGYLLSAIAFDSTLVLIFYFANKKKNNVIISKPKINKLLIYALIGPLSLFMLYPIVVCFDKLLFNLNIVPNGIPYKLNLTNYLISIVSLAILPAIAEELIFRGLIFKGLKKHGNAFSIITTAVMFAIFHMSANQLIYPFLIGLLLGVIMCKENNIIYCILVHFFNNFTSLTLSYLNVSLTFNHWTYILLAIVLALIFLSIILFLIFRHKQNTQKLQKDDKKYLIISLSVMIFIWIIIFMSSLGVFKI